MAGGGAAARGAEALFHHHYTATIQLDSTRQRRRLWERTEEASSGAADCMWTTAAAGRKEGRQAGRLSSTYAYAPTNSYCGAAPRKVVRRCSQFERIKESRAREEEGRGNRGAGGGVVLISPLLGASTKRIRPMERATCSSLNIDSSRRRLPRSPCHDKLLQG